MPRRDDDPRPPDDIPAVPPAGRATRGPLHMVGNAHIDATWLWPWQEGYQEVRATFRAALDRIAEYPDFVFTCDSVAYLAWIEEHDPDLFVALQAQVAAGRFEIVGGWWVEPDCNIPSGESFARHALYSQRYLAEKFGRIATVGCNVDPFGQNATIPQLLARSGMDAYVFMRPQVHEKELPGPTFWWRGLDGSRVLCYRIPHEYCSPAGHLDLHVRKALAQLPHTDAPLMCCYGVGNHGGGPTRDNIDSILELGTKDQFPRLMFSSMRAFIDAAGRRDDIPGYTGEIQPHGVGCYSAHSGIKQWLRRSEHALQAAEKWATVAAVVGAMPAQNDVLEHAWRQVLLNQFHDSAAGTALPSAYDEARDQLGEARAIAARVQNRALQSISRRIALEHEPATVPLVVFNPHPWPVGATVEVELGAGLGEGPYVARPDDGPAAAVQHVRSTTTTGGRRRLLVPVELPPLGYRVYRLRRAPAATTAVPAGPGDLLLENPQLRAAVDPRTGWLSSLIDKATGVDLIDTRAAAAPHAVVLDDGSDTWGHGVVSYSDVRGAFRPTSVRRTVSGPVRQSIRVESRYGSSTLVEDLVLDRDARALEVRVRIDWHERLTMLKLRFPTALDDATATHEIPYGHLVRANGGHEAPSQAWVDVSGRVGAVPAGLSVLDDAKYGVDVAGGEIGMTAVRSPAYAWHDPMPLPEDGDYDLIDQGEQRFTYRLLPHAGDWRAAGTVRAAAELNQPPVAVIESAHPEGDLPGFASFAEVRGHDVILTVLKHAEDGSGDIVARGYETAGRRTTASLALTVLDRTVDLELAAGEIVTVRVPRDATAATIVTDLIEGLTVVAD